MTVNIRSAPGDEGARIKHWTTHVSVEEGEKLTKTYADVLGAILDHADHTVSQMDNESNKASASASVTPKRPVMAQRAQSQNFEKPQPNQGATLGKDLNRRPMLGPRQRTREIIKATIVETMDEMPQRPELPHQRTRDIIRAAVGETLDQLKKSGSLVRRVSNSANLSDIVGHQLHRRTTSTAMRPDLKDIVASDESKETLKAPRYEAEAPEEICNVLRSLWSPLLNIIEEHIRPDSSFFGLGGDSILAMELARGAREHDLTLTVADIFGSPTFSEMARILANSAKKKQERISGAQAAMISEIRDELVQPTEPDRFALVDSTNTEAFIQDYICPKIGVFRGGIVDAFPVTDFQALAVAGTLVESRWMLNYFTFDGSGFLDLERLRRSVSKLVQRYDILRTVFIPCGNRFFQVQLRHVRPQLQVYQTEEDFGNYTQHLRDHSPDASPKLGEPYVQLIVLRRPSSHAHRIILRMSHAQYDGVCLPRIMEAFQAGYEGRPLPPAPVQFAKYVLEGSGVAGPGHYDYWRSLLKGSSMTSVVQREQPKYGASELKSKTLTRNITLPALTTRNITTSTILKAAWTSALAQLSGRSDIVFGNLISGRNVAVEGVESIVGPCLNILPVRITLEPTWTALDLLRRIQNQQVASMPYESLGFREIVQHCTSWPEWTYFPTMVQHQNLAGDTTLTLDRTKYKVGCLSAQDTLADITVVSTPKANDVVEISMGFIDDGSIVPAFIDTALDLLCSLAQSFASNPSHLLPSVANPSGSKPLTQQHSDIPKADSPVLGPMLRGLTKRDVSDLADMLTRAWRMVLPSTSKNNTTSSSPLNLYSSFYELGGDLVSLASLTAFLESEGFDVRIEDMIKRPTLGEQVALLSGKRDRDRDRDVEDGSLPASTRQSVDAADGAGGVAGGRASGAGVAGGKKKAGEERKMSLQRKAGRSVLDRSLRMARRVGAGGRGGRDV